MRVIDSWHVPKVVRIRDMNIVLTVVINPENASELLVVDEDQNRILTVNMDNWYVPRYHSVVRQNGQATMTAKKCTDMRHLSRHSMI